MTQYQRLFLIADPGMRHSPALQRAAALAQASGAALHIGAFVEPPLTLRLLDAPGQKQTRERTLQAFRQWLADETGLMRSKGIEVTGEVVWTHEAPAEILRHVEEMQADMLIKDLQHEPLLKRAFIAPLDWHLLRDCPVQVHLVGEVLTPLPRKVVAAVDTSLPEAEVGALNRNIVQAATALALQSDAELHLLHTYDLSAAYLAYSAPGAMAWGAEFVEQLRQAREGAFTALADEYGVPASSRHFVLGTPTLTLAEFARTQHMDVIVMGRVQRKGLSKLIGSTTEHILNQSPCSVLAIAPQVS